MAYHPLIRLDDITTLATETLAVDRLQTDRDDRNEFDAMYDQHQAEQQVKKLPEPSSSTSETDYSGSSEDDTFDTPEEDTTPDPSLPDDDSEDVPEDVPEDTSDPKDAVETYHRGALEAYIATIIDLSQHRLILDRRVSLEEWGAAVTAEQPSSTFKYLKEIGANYAPVALQHVYKGILKSLVFSIRAISVGTLKLDKQLTDMELSYQSLTDKIADARRVISTLESSETPEGSIDDPDLLTALVIGQSIDLDRIVTTLKRVNDDYFDHLRTSCLNNISTTLHIVDHVLSDVRSTPTNLLYETSKFNGFVIWANPSQYPPSSSLVQTYRYHAVLPGNLWFMGYLPNPDYSSRDELIEAYNASGLYLALATTDGAPESLSIPYMPIDEITRLLDSLELVCESLKTHRATLEVIKKARSRLKPSLKLYLTKLTNSQDRISIADSLVEFIVIKSKYLDNVYIRPAYKLEEYTAKVVSMLLSLIAKNLSAYT